MVVMPHIQMVEKNHLREIALLPSRAAADVEFSCITPMQLPEVLIPTEVARDSGMMSPTIPI
jgi:hypothetical protein